MEQDSIDDYSKRLGYSAKRNNRPDILYCPKCGRTLNMKTYKCDFCEPDHEIDSAVNDEPEDIRQEKNDILSASDIQEESNDNENMKRSRRAKKSISVKKIVLSVLGLMLLFAISVSAFYIIINRSLIHGDESMATAEPLATVTAAATSVPTSEPAVKYTEKPTKAPDKATSKPTKAPSKPTDEPTRKPLPSMSDSLYPSDERIITERELDALSREEIKLIYYEIYARHGMTFDDDFLIEYFENRRGYLPTETDEEKVEAKFSDKEKENIQIIEEYQIEKGWRSE